MLKPLPSSPSRFAAGTLTLSIMTAHVGCAFQPSLSSALPKLSPEVSCYFAACNFIPSIQCANCNMHSSRPATTFIAGYCGIYSMGSEWHVWHTRYMHVQTCVVFSCAWLVCLHGLTSGSSSKSADSVQ